MELKQIKELMAAMEKAGIRRLRIKDKDEYELELERKDEVGAHPAPYFPPHPISHPEAHHRLPSHSVPHYREHHEEPSKPEEKKQEGRFITSPMVGTLYSAASPDDPQFIKVGDKIDENTVICIIEAMKVMNEVKAGLSGTVVEILVQNAHPVEFGTKIIRVV